MLKKCLIVILVCLYVVSSLSIQYVEADDYTFYSVIVTSDYKEVYDKNVNILIDEDEVFIDIDNLSFFTGFSTEISGDILTLKRSTKTVEIDIKKKTISYRKSTEKIKDIIDYNGTYYLPLNTASYYLNSRCYFNEGYIGFLTAETTYDEMYEKYVQYYINSSYLMPRDTNQNFGSMLVMYLWSGLINDYSAYNDEDMEIIYRKIVANDEEKQNDFVELVETYDEIHTITENMTKPVKEIGKLIMGKNYDAIEDLTESLLESDDYADQAVGGFLEFNDAISPVFDFAKDIADDIELISNYNYIYVDALEKGYLCTSQTNISCLQRDHAWKIIDMCNNNRVSDESLIVSALEVLESEVIGEIGSWIGESSLSFVNAVVTGLKLVGEFTGINDDVDGYWEKWAHAAFQLEVRDIGTDLMYEMNRSAESMNVDNLESIKYNYLLFLRTITFMNEEYEIAIPGFVQNDLDTIACIEDYELWFDDINYLRDVCLDAEEIEEFFSGGDGDEEGESEAAKQDGNTWNNIENGGIACEYNGDVYYKGLDGCIHLLKNDGTSVKINDDYSKYINIYNDKIYYCNLDDSSYCYCMDLDGSNREKVPYEIIGKIYIKDGMLYYNETDKGTYRLNIDNNEIEKVSDYYFRSFYNDEILYYEEMESGDYNYFFINEETGELLILSEEKHSDFQITDDTIFTIDWKLGHSDDIWVDEKFSEIDSIYSNSQPLQEGDAILYTLPKKKEDDGIAEVFFIDNKLYSINFERSDPFGVYLCSTDLDSKLAAFSETAEYCSGALKYATVNMNIAGDYLFVEYEQSDVNTRTLWLEIIDISHDKDFQNYVFGSYKNLYYQSGGGD